MLVISTIIYLMLSYVITLRLNKEILISDWVINFFLTTVSLNILIAEIPHFFKALNNPIIFLLIQGILAIGSIVFLIDPRQLIFNERLSRVNIKFQKWGGFEIVLHGFVFFIFIFILYVGFQGPINNSDSLHTHLIRIFYWLQHNSLENWNALNYTQISYPINISVQGLWIFLLSRSEIYFFLIQWLALVISIIAIYKISITLGARPVGALISCLISLSFPVILLQTFSFQGDVFIATFALCSTYYLLLFIKNRTKISLYISIIIISISIGTKQPIFLFIPLFCLVIFILIVMKIIKPRILLNILGLFIVSFMLFSSFKFIQSSFEKTYHVSAMVAPEFYNNFSTMDKKPMQGYMTIGLRYLYQAFSIDGIAGQLNLNLHSERIDMFKKISGYLSVDLESKQFLTEPDTPFSYSESLPINEDTAWFGILSLPVMFVVLFITLLSKDKFRINYLVLSLVLIGIFVFGVVLIRTGWGPTNGRYMTIPVLLFMPLVSFIIPKNRVTGGVIASILSIASVLLTISILTFNDSRPLVRQFELYNFQKTYINKIEVTNIFNSMYRKGLYELTSDLLKTAPNRTPLYQSDYYDKLFFQNSHQIENIEFINLYIDENQPLYLNVKKTVLEYALFGRNKTRDLYPVRNLDDIESNSYVIVSKELSQNSEDFKLIAENDDYLILFKR